MTRSTIRTLPLLALTLAMLGTAFPGLAQEIGAGDAVKPAGAVTELTDAAEVGDHRIRVSSTEILEGGKDARLVLKSIDGEAQQAACVARIGGPENLPANASPADGPSIKLERPLDVSFGAQSFVVQGPVHSENGSTLVADVRLPVNRGSEAISISDTSKIDPWKKIAIISADGQGEIRCLNAIVGAGAADRDDADHSAPYLSVLGDLQHAYEAGDQVIQGVRSNAGEGTIAKIVSSAVDKGMVLELDSLDNLDPFSDILVRSADGSRQEIHCVQSFNADDNTVTLSQGLSNSFGSGSEVLQGSSVARAFSAGVKTRVKGCDCCGPGGAAWWWLTASAAVPAVLVLSEEEDDPIPPALSPITP